MYDTLKVFEDKMKKSIDRLTHEFAIIRAGRANPAILNKIMVDYYDTPTPINQMAAVSISEARILVISPWDLTTLSMIERAIQQSDIGINPTNDGKVLRLAFPQLTEERRKEIVKEINKIKEESKISVRNIRRDAMDKLKALKKDGKISEDEIKDQEDEVQNLVNKFCKEIDSISAAKEKEVLEI
ncbi:MAG: ribosome recycling factor [Oscillospiraceae bacterium]|nr:ribosome recycling factor [Oscillospiraceae bacterium]